MSGQNLSSQGTPIGIARLEVSRLDVYDSEGPGNVVSVPSVPCTEVTRSDRDGRAGFAEERRGQRETSRTVNLNAAAEWGKPLMIRRNALNAQGRWHVGGRIVGAMALLIAMTVFAEPSVAVTGDVKQSVTLPLAAQCGSAGGTSVALVQGSKVNFPAFPTLLVTSCFASGGSAAAITKRATLYFDDPLTVAAAAPVKTLLTHLAGSGAAFSPGSGWAQLAIRANKGDLLACGDEGSVYVIDYSVFSATADGTAAPVPKPSGVSIASCVGLTWDPSNSSVYQSTGGTIFHWFITPAGAVAASPLSFSAPTGCTVSGLSVVGGVLLASCGGSGTVYRLDKTTGVPFNTALSPSTISFGTTVLNDLECDPVTYGLNNIDVVWSRNSSTEQVLAYRVPAAMCGLPPTATVLAPAACPVNVPAYWTNNDPVNGSPKDTDGDGLWDCWEDPARWGDGKPGIDFEGDGTRDLVLCANVDANGDGVPDTQECADPTVKDLFVEIDYMQNADGTSSHKPDPLALLAVRTAFATAPVDSPTGIKTHFLVDEAMPHNTLIALEPCTAAATAANGALDFDAAKGSFFGTSAERGNVQTINAKRMAFRYMIFGHNLVGTTSSGCSELPGDDSVISLGNFGPADLLGHKRGTTDQQAGTVMHEFGHLLGLRHGGKDNINCKPNYLSVMSYSRQFADLLTNRQLDYSRVELPAFGTPLNESNLNESQGIGVLPTVNKTAYGAAALTTPQVASITAGVVTPIDWSGGGGASTSGVSADINKLSVAGCTGDGTGNLLSGYNDWENLQYNARASFDFAAGARSTTTDKPATDTPALPGENSDKNEVQELASFQNADRDHDNIPDAFACGPFSAATPEATTCLIDIKPGSNPKVISKSAQSNIQVAIFGTSNAFSSVRDVNRESLTLNEVGVKLNNGNKGTCSTQSLNGRMVLLCQFPTAALPLGTNYSILEGTATIGSTTVGFRARDAVTVVP
jgi:hypothetical protein